MRQQGRHPDQQGLHSPDETRGYAGTSYKTPILRGHWLLDTRTLPLVPEYCVNMRL